MRHLKSLSPALMLLLVLIAGCTALGIQSPKTASQGTDFAYAELTGIVNATTLGINQGTVSKEDGAAVLKFAKDAGAALNVADIALADGDPTKAQERITFALGLLGQAQQYLADHETKKVRP